MVVKYLDYKLNAIPSPTNKKDYSLDMYIAGSEMPKLTEPVEPVKAHYMPRAIYDQGQDGMCVDFTFRELAESFMLAELESEYVEIANGFFYGFRGERDWQGEGLVPVEVLNIWRKYGVPRRKDFNTTGTYEQCKAAVEAKGKDIFNLALSQKIKSFVRLRNVHEIATYIKKTGFPVPIMFPVYSNIVEAQGTGIVPFPAGTFLGRHEVLACEIFYRNGMPRVRFQNSWNENWGDKGFGDIDPSMISESWGVWDDYPESLSDYPTEMVFQVGNKRVITDKGTVVMGEDEVPILHNDRIKLPIRKPFELIGWYVDWYQNIETDPVTKEKAYRDYVLIHKYPSDEHTLEKFGIKR